MGGFVHTLFIYMGIFSSEKINLPFFATHNKRFFGVFDTLLIQCSCMDFMYLQLLILLLPNLD